MVAGRKAASASTVTSWSRTFGGTPLSRAASSRQTSRAWRTASSGSGQPSGVRRPSGRPARAADRRNASRWPPRCCRQSAPPTNPPAASPARPPSDLVGRPTPRPQADDRLQPARRLAGHRAAPEAAGAGPRHVQLAYGPGHGHVQKAAFLPFGGGGEAAAHRDQALFHPGDPHQVPLQALGPVETGQRDGVGRPGAVRPVLDGRSAARPASRPTVASGRSRGQQVARVEQGGSPGAATAQTAPPPARPVSARGGAGRPARPAPGQHRRGRSDFVEQRPAEPPADHQGIPAVDQRLLDDAELGVRAGQHGHRRPACRPSLRRRSAAWPATPLLGPLRLEGVRTGRAGARAGPRPERRSAPSGPSDRRPRPARSGSLQRWLASRRTTSAAGQRSGNERRSSGSAPFQP